MIGAPLEDVEKVSLLARAELLPLHDAAHPTAEDGQFPRVRFGVGWRRIDHGKAALNLSGNWVSAHMHGPIPFFVFFAPTDPFCSDSFALTRVSSGMSSCRV